MCYVCEVFENVPAHWPSHCGFNEGHSVLEGRKGGVGPKPPFNMHQVCSGLVPLLGPFRGKPGSAAEACLRACAVGWLKQTVAKAGNSRRMHTKEVMRQLAS